MTDWQPIETAPRDGTEFICWKKESGLELRARYCPEYGCFETFGRVDYDEDGWEIDYGTPTHWMLLPEPPKEASA